MRVKKFLKLFLIVFLVVAVQFANVEKAVAYDTVGLGQRILPVCLVYLAPGGAILNIWSNVSQIDDAYVLKFIDRESRELPSSGKLFSQYIQKSKKDLVERNKTESTQFLQSNNSLEEVRTIV